MKVRASSRSVRLALPAALAIAPLLAVAGCAPGGSADAPAATGGATSAAEEKPVNTDPSSMGNVTLTVWDQEVRGGGNAQITKLNADFQKKYPNITIKRNSRSFDDLVKTLRLALSGNDAPDIVQANNTRSQMGEFVKAKQIIPLDPYMNPRAPSACSSRSPGMSGVVTGPTVGPLGGIAGHLTSVSTSGAAPAARGRDPPAGRARRRRRPSPRGAGGRPRSDAIASCRPRRARRAR